MLSRSKARSRLTVMSIIPLVVITDVFVVDVLMSRGGEYEFAHGTYFILLVCRAPGDSLNDSNVPLGVLDFVRMLLHHV